MYTHECLQTAYALISVLYTVNILLYSQISALFMYQLALIEIRVTLL